MNNIFNETLIRNLDAGYLYWNIKDDKLIQEYETLKAEQNKIGDNDIHKDELIKELGEKSKEIFTFTNKNIILSNKDLRFRYTGTLSDSLMSRKLRQVSENISDKNSFRTVRNSDGSETDYTDIIINLKFKSDIMIQDGNRKKKAYNPETKEIEELPERKMKRLISKKKLRKMAYRDGVIINGIHYVNYQRTSSKARIGNNLFINEKYFEYMEDWQNMGIPFRKMVKTRDKTNPNKYEKGDIVSIRSYQSLTSSSIIGTLGIDPDRILLIDDVCGQSTMQCNVIASVSDEKGHHLEVKKDNYKQVTDLWDGQSLLDKSVFAGGTYYDRKDKQYKHFSDKGFMLLRNHFFKTAVFNTNLQDYYRERFKYIHNPSVFDKYGDEFDPYNILMVTTKNSVKILKFADIICTYMIADTKKAKLKELEAHVIKLRNEQNKNRQHVTSAKRKLTTLMKYYDVSAKLVKEAEYELQKATETYNKNQSRLEKEIAAFMKPVKMEQEKLTWRWYRDILKKQNQEFGVCKYEKISKFGNRQQLWYQVLGSLNLSEDELWKLAEPQVNEINLMKKYPAFFKHYLNMKENRQAGEAMMLALLSVNDDVSRTKWYTDYRRSKISSILKKLYMGKVQLENSDFCVLVGNPYEMLRAGAGDKITSSILADWECWCQRYDDGEELYGFRSPHICSGNNALLINRNCDEWKWFNFTDRIIAVNFWGKGAFLSPCWNGCDTDSDAAFIGNEPTILNAVRKTKDFLIPINSLKPEPKTLEYTEDNMATVDGQLCNDFIGKVCNQARDLQSFYWHLYNSGMTEAKEKYLNMIYEDICILEVLSNIAIDSAKRRYDINIASEIKRLKDRPYMKIEGAIIPRGAIVIKEKRYKKSLSEDTVKDYEKLVERKNKMTILSQIEKMEQEIDKLLKTEDTYHVRPEFTKNLIAGFRKKGRKFLEDEERELYRQKHLAYVQEQKRLNEKIYYKLESPMDSLTKVIHDKVKRCDRTEYIAFIELLNKIPKGVKADYNRVKAIKKICLCGIRLLNQVQKYYVGGDIAFDEMYEEKRNIEKNIINHLKYSNDAMTDQRKITEWDIHLLLRSIYDIHPKKDKHGKIIKNVNGSPVIVDKRDKDLLDARVGGLTIQWVFAAFPDVFLRAIKQNKGVVSTVVKVDSNNTSDKNSRLDNGHLLSGEDRVFKLYGEEYKIVTKPVSG